jgi:sugar O-acyltransferase (sialic acid O-acetyltransferase NeuD family)
MVAAMSRLVIYGAGGFGREVVTAARNERRSIVFAADGPPIDFCGLETIAASEIAPEDEVVIAIADCAARVRLANLPVRFGRVVAPTVVIGPEVEIGEGAILCDFAMVTASARIGRHFHGNIYSYVAHDCVIGDFVTFAPKVCCNGNVHIGDGAYVGTGAVLRNGRPGTPLRIGAGAIVGMGAVVTKDVPPGATVVGNPAHVIEPACAPSS